MIQILPENFQRNQISREIGTGLEKGGQHIVETQLLNRGTSCVRFAMLFQFMIYEQPSTDCYVAWLFCLLDAKTVFEVVSCVTFTRLCGLYDDELLDLETDYFNQTQHD